MVRQKQRTKTFEDLYSNHNNIYSSSGYPAAGILPLTTKNHPLGGIKAPRSSDKELAIYGSARRRKNRKGPEKKDEKTLINEEKLNVDNLVASGKHQQHHQHQQHQQQPPQKELSSNKTKSSKDEKSYGLNTNFTPMYDNKNLVSFMEQQKTEHEKDEDTEEFFELIRETVENAVGKTLSELLNRNFREVCHKVESLSEQLNATNERLNKLQSEVQNKVSHYGEENSRHFRYLCMKSEYDKMFYQHQNMITNATTNPAAAAAAAVVASATGPGSGTTLPPLTATGGDGRQSTLHSFQQSLATNNEKVHTTCNTCRGEHHHQQQQQQQQPSPSNIHSDELPSKNEDRSTSASEKSSDMGMKDVLEQIQKFCVQLQRNDRSNHSMTTKNTKASRHCINVHRHGKHEGDGDGDGDDDDNDNDNDVDDDDDDDLIMSSDEMSMLSVEVKRAEGDSMNFGGE